MKINYFFYRIKAPIKGFLVLSSLYALKLIHMQLFITTVSLPLCAWWGLPFSLLSPFSNIIFAPFLTLFLALSTIIFFCELFRIPSFIFIKGLETTQHIWISTMKLASSNYLIGFIQPSIFWVTTLILATLLSATFIRSSLKNFCFLTLLCALFFIFFTPRSGTMQLFFIPFTHKKTTKNLAVFESSGSITVFDHATLSKSSSATSFVAYSLMQEIVRKTGRTKIDNVITVLPSAHTYHAFIHALHAYPIKKITVISNNKRKSYAHYRAYQECKKEAAKKGCIFQEIGYRFFTVFFSPLSRSMPRNF